MALGGGTWTSQNKVLPGTYVVFSNVQMASATLSDRGVAAIPVALDWGPAGEVFTVTSCDFQKKCKPIFGYSYEHDNMLPMREIFKHATSVHFYRLTASNAVKAKNDFATAKYPGTRGNALSIVITANVDEPTKFDVQTYLDLTCVDTQTVKTSSELIANDYVTFSSTALALTASTPLTGGSNGSEIDGDAYQKALDAFEGVSFNALGCPSTNATIIGLFTAFVKRMRDEVGAKFQLVVHQTAADYEGAISSENSLVNAPDSVGAAGLVYWLTGAEAACEVNKSLTNAKYDGELEILTNHTQTQLSQALQAGKLIFHKVNGDVRILEDVNTLQTTTDTHGDVFKSNQTIRVIDQIANDVAVLFNTRYLGVVPNDAAGRTSLWNDIVKLHQTLETMRAITDFSPDSVTVDQGDTKKSVVCTVQDLNIVNAMAQLYMSVIIT